MSVQRVQTSLTYLPDILTASSKTVVSKYALGVVTTLVAQDTLSQPNIYYNYREETAIPSIAATSTTVATMTPGILTGNLISFRYTEDTSKPSKVYFRTQSITLINCLSRVGGFAVATYLIIKLILSPIMAVTYFLSASKIFLAPANDGFEQKNMWRRYERELTIPRYLKQ